MSVNTETFPLLHTNWYSGFLQTLLREKWEKNFQLLDWVKYEKPKYLDSSQGTWKLWVRINFRLLFGMWRCVLFEVCKGIGNSCKDFYCVNSK